ncbi:hypothetical protein VTI74DRAFT_5249 [Chaetomium olivicolor]
MCQTIIFRFTGGSCNQNIYPRPCIFLSRDLKCAALNSSSCLHQLHTTDAVIIPIPLPCRHHVMTDPEIVEQIEKYNTTLAEECRALSSSSSRHGTKRSSTTRRSSKNNNNTATTTTNPNEPILKLRLLSAAVEQRVLLFATACLEDLLRIHRKFCRRYMRHWGTPAASGRGGTDEFYAGVFEKMRRDCVRRIEMGRRTYRDDGLLRCDTRAGPEGQNNLVRAVFWGWEEDGKQCSIDGENGDVLWPWRLSRWYVPPKENNGSQKAEEAE